MENNTNQKNRTGGSRAELRLCSPVRNLQGNASGANMEVQWMSGRVHIHCK